MIQSNRIRFFGLWLLGISLVIAGVLPQSQAEAPAGANSRKQCARRDGLSFNSVGLWSRLPAVLEQYGQLSRVDPLVDISSNRVYAHYIYKGVKLFIFNSIVWQIDVLSPNITSQAGIRLSSDFSAVEKMLGVKL